MSPTGAWVIALSDGFRRLCNSSDRAFRPRYGADVALPKRLLQTALHSGARGDGNLLAHMLPDSYEMPMYQLQLASQDRKLHLEMFESTLKLSVGEFIRKAESLDSADELSIFIAQQLMRERARSLMMLTPHDMDIAHTGAYSLYIDAIRRADQLCAELRRMMQSDPEYKDRTTMYILPDFGRDADDDFLECLPARRFAQLVAPSLALTLTDALTAIDWVRELSRFVTKLTAWLWSSGQIDGFRRASTRNYLQAAQNHRCSAQASCNGQPVSWHGRPDRTRCCFAMRHGIGTVILTNSWERLLLPSRTRLAHCATQRGTPTTIGLR